MYVYAREGALSPEECEAAVRLFARPAQQGVIEEPHRAPGVVERPTVRRSRVSFLERDDVETLDFHKKIAALLFRANEVSFQYELCSFEPYQLAEYGEGDGYDWHLDLGAGGAARRKLSASVQLSASDDYEGGDLELWGAQLAPRAQGSLVVFPAYALHRVTPVTRGLRRSLVVWASGDRPFR